MSSAWFFLPAVLRDKLFTVHGTLGFALVLAAWMYSDVPSTNVLGPDAERVVAAIDDPVMMRRLLNAKYIVLWALVTPLGGGVRSPSLRSRITISGSGLPWPASSPSAVGSVASGSEEESCRRGGQGWRNFFPIPSGASWTREPPGRTLRD